MLFAASQMGLEGWPLALVICVGIIGFVSWMIGKWPWER